MSAAHVEIECPTVGCHTIMVKQSIPAAVESMQRLEYEQPCRTCQGTYRLMVDLAAEEALASVEARTPEMRDADANRYLRRAAKRKRASFWHDAMHALMEQFGVPVCFACRCLTGNRSRPMSHQER